MRYLGILVLAMTLLSSPVCSQKYFDGNYEVEKYTYMEEEFTLYHFAREGAAMKAKYFATDAYSQYLQWKSGKEVLLVTAGAFSTSFKKDGIPVGLCVDNGKPINSRVDKSMDAMVIVYNGGSQIGGIAVVDLDVSKVKVNDGGTYKYYDPRSSYSELISLKNWGENYGLTLFQTMLAYSEKQPNKNYNLEYGKSQERRFLALCYRNGALYHVVIDAPAELEMNKSAKYVKFILEYDGYDVDYLLNLDTGGKNILYAHNGSYLRDLKPSDAKIQDATNLLIYYR